MEHPRSAWVPDRDAFRGRVAVVAGRPAAPGAASRRRWAKRARRSSAPGAAAARGHSGPTTTGPRRSRRPPSSSRAWAGPGSPPWSTTSTPTRCKRLAEPIRARPRPHRRAGQRHLGRRGAQGRPRAMEHAHLGARPRRRSPDPPARDRHPPHHVASPAAAPHRPAGRPARRGDRRHRRLQRLALPDLGLLRPGQGRGEPAGLLPGTRAESRTARPRSRSRRVASLGDDARQLRRHRGELARRPRSGPPPSAAAGRRRRPTSPSPNRLATSGGPSSRWRRIPTGRDGTSNRSAPGASRREYGFTDIDGSRPDIWRYIEEVRERGLEADPSQYR